MAKTIKWKIHLNSGEHQILRLRQVGAVALRELDLPVWQAVSDEFYRGSIVRYEDMPADLAQVFYKSQNGATIPFPFAAYLHDFGSFLGRDLKV